MISRMRMLSIGWRQRQTPIFKLRELSSATSDATNTSKPLIGFRKKTSVLDDFSCYCLIVKFYLDDICTCT